MFWAKRERIEEGTVESEVTMPSPLSVVPVGMVLLGTDVATDKPAGVIVTVGVAEGWPAPSVARGVSAGTRSVVTVTLITGRSVMDGAGVTFSPAGSEAVGKTGGGDVGVTSAGRIAVDVGNAPSPAGGVRVAVGTPLGIGESVAVGVVTSVGAKALSGPVGYRVCTCSSWRHG